MPSKKAGYAVRLWMNNEDLEHIKKLSDKTELSQVELMTRIMHAGLAAICEQDYRLNLPLKFSITGNPEPARYQMNEPKTPNRK